MSNNLVSNIIPPSRLDTDSTIFEDVADSEVVDENGDPVVDGDGGKVRGKKS